MFIMWCCVCFLFFIWQNEIRNRALFPPYFVKLFIVLQVSVDGQLVPDQVTFSQRQSCVPSTLTTIFQGTRSYQNELKHYVSQLGNWDELRRYIIKFTDIECLFIFCGLYKKGGGFSARVWWGIGHRYLILILTILLDIKLVFNKHIKETKNWEKLIPSVQFLISIWQIEIISTLN